MQKEEQMDMAFKEAYAHLNAAQKEAVDALEGPVMVIAGPGTGKTQILTLRIANLLLKTDTRPENILALTFTESGAKAMRERLHTYIGAAAYKVAIFTFHGFAQRLIGDYPDAYTRIIGGTPASDLQKISILESILSSADIKLLSPLGNRTYYVAPILRVMSELKKEYIRPDALAQIIAHQETQLQTIEQFHQKGAHKGKVRSEYTKKESVIAKNKELLFVYRQYEASLREQKLYDFEDMIIETITALQDNETMLRTLQETYLYVLADEHQDVNGSQNRILELLCSFHERPNIFVVGDEKQSIYRFQGASLENFLYFEDVYNDTKTIALKENYRSGQLILDAAHSLVAVDEGPLASLRVPLVAQAVKDSSVTSYSFSHQAIEDAWVCTQVKDMLAEGVLPEEIAVIVRTNKEVEEFAQLLRKEGIVVDASADGDILQHPLTHAVCDFIDAVVNPQDEKALFSLLHGAFWGVPIDDVIRITRARSYDQSLFEVLQNRDILIQKGVKCVDAAIKIADVLQEAKKREAYEAPHRILEFMLRESGFLDHVLSHDPLDGARVVRRLYDEVEEMVRSNRKATLRGVQEVLSLYRAHALPVQAPSIHGNKKAVQVMTAHKSKGLEFTAVCIPHLVDSVWGGTNRRNYFDIPQTKHISADAFDRDDDERRLLYVAMTRAKSSLFLSFSDVAHDGRELITSRLFEDIDSAYIEQKDTTVYETNFNPLTSIQKPVVRETLDTALFSAHLHEKGLSATALNNYLHSPWDYVYRTVLRIPEVQALPLQFGTAIHGVMEWVSSVYAQHNRLPDAPEVKAALERELSKLPITTDEFVKMHEKGLQSLLTYIDHMQRALPHASKVEFSIRVMLPTGIPEFPEVPLTGKLDRLDFNAEGTVVQVVDYKTGKPKTRNDIEGNTENSNGDYKRQLTFYALLLSLYEDPMYACTTGVLSFIEPDTKGKIHEEVFQISHEEIEALKAQIIAVVQEIINGTFLAQPCDPAVSSYCHLARELFKLPH